MLSHPSHPALNVRDDRDTPLFRGGTGEMLVLIWGLNKANYFCAQDWTTQISLNRLTKFQFARKRVRA
jgi:hypothetical protein